LKLRLNAGTLRGRDAKRYSTGCRAIPSLSLPEPFVCERGWRTTLQVAGRAADSETACGIRLARSISG